MAEAFPAGYRVVVTRAADQADELMQRLTSAGATPIALPTIAIAPPSAPEALAAARRAASEYDGFIFTSTNAVAAFLAAPVPVRPAGSWVCAVGPATAAALAQIPGWTASHVPAQHSAEGVIAALAALPMAEKRVLFPRAAAGRELILHALAARGARIETVAAYRTVIAEASRATAQVLFPVPGPPGAECVVFSSGSTVRNLAALLGDDFRTRLRAVALAAFGPATRSTMAELDLACAIEAPAATVESLVAALAAHAHARTARS